MKKFWYKSAALVMSGAVLSLGLGDGCLSAVIQRILVANLFD
jgi:hypothetical protein